MVISQNEKSLFGSYDNAKLIIYIPKEFSFSNANITTGAGKFTVDTLSADKLYLELGAGEVNIDKLYSNRSCEIDGGAGKITISDGILYNFDLDMGVGKLDLTAAVYGESQIDNGIGKSDITFIGAQDEYRLEFDKGIGSVKVDKQEMSDGDIFSNGVNEIEINGGIGEIDVTFKQ